MVFFARCYVQERPFPVRWPRARLPFFNYFFAMPTYVRPTFTVLPEPSSQLAEFCTDFVPVIAMFGLIRPLAGSSPILDLEDQVTRTIHTH